MDRRPPGLRVGRREREASWRRPTCHLVQVLIVSPRPERGIFFLCISFDRFCNFSIHFPKKILSWAGSPKAGACPFCKFSCPKRGYFCDSCLYAPPLCCISTGRTRFCQAAANFILTRYTICPKTEGNSCWIFSPGNNLPVSFINAILKPQAERPPDVVNPHNKTSLSFWKGCDSL